MRKTTKYETKNNMTVDLEDLAKMLGCGKATAKAIGEKSCARIKIGRRVLYKLDIVEGYLNEEADRQNGK